MIAAPVSRLVNKLPEKFKEDLQIHVHSENNIRYSGAVFITIFESGHIFIIDVFFVLLQTKPIF